MNQTDETREPNGGAVLEARSLSKRYEDGRLALDAVSFSVRAGEIFTMLGGNGAGKTTTINIFLNFIPPTSGQALIQSIPTHVEPLKAKRRVAFVSENVMLYNNFTALENLDYFTRLGGRSDFTKEQYRAALLRAGLQEEAHDKKLRGFSKGMRQKCGIAIAILKNADAILLDEPTSGLDPKAGYEFSQTLRSLRDEGKAILMSTHDIFRAKEVSDVIGIMKDGRLVMARGREELGGENLERLYLQYMGGQY